MQPQRFYYGIYSPGCWPKEEINTEIPSKWVPEQVITPVQISIFLTWYHPLCLQSSDSITINCTIHYGDLKLLRGYKERISNSWLYIQDNIHGRLCKSIRCHIYCMKHRHPQNVHSHGIPSSYEHMPRFPVTNHHTQHCQTKLDHFRSQTPDSP